MNPIAKEIASYLGTALMTKDEFIEHYGVGHEDGGHSGRYPWGSGKDDYQHSIDFLGRVEQLKKKGWTETPENIEKEFGISVKEYRMEKSICNNVRTMQKVKRAKELQGDPENPKMGASEIGRIMGARESTVREWLKADREEKLMQTFNTVEMLKQRLSEFPKEKQMIDVGVDVEKELNISRERLDTALYVLQSQGYNLYSGRIPQATNPNQMTTQKVLADKDIKFNEIYNYANVQTLTDYISRDGGDTYEKKFYYPESMDSKRLMIRYADDTGPDGIKGIEKDGVVELRRGVADLSLGDSRYSQVRILVDGTHYIKGMAVYSDNMPDGVDVVFNTNKGRDKSKLEVLKEIKDDPENPFGSAIKDANQGGQYWYDAKTGKRCGANDPDVKDKKLGLINKRSDEGDWTEWKDALPSQFLSKQSLQLAKKQLNLAKEKKEEEFEEYMSLNNPTIKKYYLEKFASNCDSAAVDLKAAALPGQKYHVIIPVNTLKDTEVYAPQYKDGTKLALIRYPHGGTFEIPILTVNNKNELADKIISKQSIDAVGITKKVADQLSGADFDGDTVMCIPTHNGKVKITSTKPLGYGTSDDLRNFDPKLEYGTKKSVDENGDVAYYREGRKVNIMKNTNTQMGIISNLITDMTLGGADYEKEIKRAVKHSMVVIDAEKHKLDWQQSYIDNGIAELQRLYQPKYDKDGNVVGAGGASTIISRSKGQEEVPKRKGQAKINVKGKEWYDPSKPEGSLIYSLDPDRYYVKDSYNKKNGIRAIVTEGTKQWYTDPDTLEKKYGNKISYNMYDKSEKEKYEPVKVTDKKTGEVYYTNKDGSLKYRTKERTTTSTKMAETNDATTLLSNKKYPHPMETVYAEYANSMKALANRARIEMINTGNLEYSPTAKKIYAQEVSSLEAKLNNAEKNGPIERAAQRLAASEIKNKKDSNPDMKPGDVRKISQRSLTKYRNELGSVSRKNRGIVITDKEWEAIQAGAISENKLKKILNNSDPDSLRQRATPKNSRTPNATQIQRIKQMANSNVSIKQIADQLNLSTSTVSKYLKGEN